MQQRNDQQCHNIDDFKGGEAHDGHEGLGLGRLPLRALGLGGLHGALSEHFLDSLLENLARLHGTALRLGPRDDHAARGENKGSSARFPDAHHDCREAARVVLSVAAAHRDFLQVKLAVKVGGGHEVLECWGLELLHVLLVGRLNFALLRLHGHQGFRLLRLPLILHLLPIFAFHHLLALLPVDLS